MRTSLTVLPDQPCPYLPGKLSQVRGFQADSMPPRLYHRFMDAGFRRSGTVLYQPICAGCRACMPLRVPVGAFSPNKSQRRCINRNSDLHIRRGVPEMTDEKLDLYVRYITEWHKPPAGGYDVSSEALETFLYESPVETAEFEYRDGAGHLLGVGICDICSESLSSVYFYFDPAMKRRGLGTFGALYEIQEAARMGIPHYYLGYWINGCSAMQYKANYRPCEVLHPDGIWRRLEGADQGLEDSPASLVENPLI